MRPPGHIHDLIKEINRWMFNRASKDLDNRVLKMCATYLEEYQDIIVKRQSSLTMVADKDGTLIFSDSYGCTQAMISPSKNCKEAWCRWTVSFAGTHQTHHKYLDAAINSTYEHLTKKILWPKPEGKGKGRDRWKKETNTNQKNNPYTNQELNSKPKT